MRGQALKGHLDGMLLAALEDGPRHGYAIMEALRAGSGGQFDLPTGTIYPALHRLERAGLVRTTWSGEGGRRRRLYELTPAGRRMLDAIGDLPEDEREAFDLVRVQGMTQTEAAQVLGVATVTVKRRLNRGLQLLTETLADLRPQTDQA